MEHVSSTKSSRNLKPQSLVKFDALDHSAASRQKNKTSSPKDFRFDEVCFVALHSSPGGKIYNDNDLPLHQSSLLCKS